MDPAPHATNPPLPQRRRLPLFLFGMLLFIAGPALYAAQMIWLHQLQTPWYLPLLSTAGIALMALSAVQRRGVVRIVGLVVFALVCGFEWFGLLVVFRTPDYTGPVRAGQPLPAFATTRADGATFTNDDLAKGTPHLLVFYRGHW